MVSHRNMAVRQRRPLLAWSFGVATVVTLVLGVVTILRTRDMPTSFLRTALDDTKSHRRLASIPLTPNFRFDGSTSDLAQQFYRRHEAGDSADALRMGQSDLPNRIVNRLTALDLRFETLPGLLQRALLWDSGYGVDPNYDAGLIKIYSVNGVPMSEIAVSLNSFSHTGCTSDHCTDPDGRPSYRSKNCTGDQMLPATLCATELSSFSLTHTSMWATGGSDTMIPGIQVFRHSWLDPLNNTNYVVSAIHTIQNEQEPSWDNCPENPSKKSTLIIPCYVYKPDMAVSHNWSEPAFGPIVTPWLAAVKTSQKRRRLLLFVVLPLGLVAAVVITVCATCFVHRRRVAAGKPGLCSWLCGPETGPYKDIWGRSLQHTLLSPAPPMVAGGSGGASGGAGDGGGMLLSLPPTGSDVDGLQKKMPPRRSSSSVTVASDSTSSALWDRMNLVLLNDLNLYNKRLALERIHFEKQLSKGGFGEVWLAQLDDHPVAVKRLLQSRVRIEDVEAFVDEIQITAALHHPNIPRFLGVAWTTLDRLCMVIEYLPGGDLQSFLKRQGYLLTWPREKRILVMGIAKALQYLHSRAPVLIHRDIKSRNILVRDQPLTAKVTDFGVSRSVQRDCMTLGVGTPYWTAPEVLDGTVYTEKSDIYSFGVVLSEIDTCQAPYHDLQYGNDTGLHLQPFHILKMIMTGTMQPQFADSCPPQLRALAMRCLDIDPAARPTAREVVKELEQMTWE